MNDYTNEYTNEYNKKIQFWGMLSLSLSVISCFLYGFFLSYVKGYHPGWDKILTSLLSIGAIMGHNWINVADTMTYILLMGPAASYVSVLSGNVKNMKLPSVLSTLASLEIEPGTPKADILSTFCVIASTVVNTVCLILLATVGSSLLKFLPPVIFEMIKYVVPAMFGAIFTQFAMMDYKAAAISLVVAAVIINLEWKYLVVTPLEILAETMSLSSLNTSSVLSPSGAARFSIMSEKIKLRK